MEEDGWKGLMLLVTQIDSPKELSALFDLFLTIEEKETLASRFLIVRALFEGKLTQREIAEKYKVSISQITRGSNAMKIIEGKLKRFLESKLEKL
ncbi:MAG: trp operon repressor [Chlamydiae bacterium]|jgi:TrpR family trp operon transcriptional repressor|nr:trp operon repressor [Chlamydiota bacterium]